MAGWVVILAGLAYLCALFAIAHFGDTVGRSFIRGRGRTAIYALTLAVFCTSWTFYGSVGLAVRSGPDFLAIYLGPILVIGLGSLLVRRVVRLAKSQNITSIADFVAARYGKNERVAAIVALIAVIGSVPYIALQLKAISSSLSLLLNGLDPGSLGQTSSPFGDLALWVALILAAFTMAFGTRQVDTTEHQDGLMLAVAAESIIKIVTFLAVGLFVSYGLFDGVSDIFMRAAQRSEIVPLIDRSNGPLAFIVIALLSGSIILLLPRQFHVTVVENRHEDDVKVGAWAFPLYIIAINIFVIPIALASDMLMPGGVDHDMAVLELPLHHGAPILALAAFIGGLSAATAMVIVASVALAIMVSNDLVMPILLRRRAALASASGGDMGGRVLMIRRCAILITMLLSYAYYRASNEQALAAIGLISFVATAQIAPAFFGGLYWRRGNAKGAIAGLTTGIIVWAMLLLLPSVQDLKPLFAILGHMQETLGLDFLSPGASGLDRIVHGTLWSLSLNFIAYVSVSMMTRATPLERLQASAFVSSEKPAMAQAFRLWRTSVSVSDLQTAVARYLGTERTLDAFTDFAHKRGQNLEPGAEADIHLLRFAEHELASAIGAASSRLVITLLLRRRNVTKKAALKLLDDASAAIQYNRDLLQHALDHARQGITVFDRDLRLMCWNREFQTLFQLPDALARTGVGLDEIIRFNAQRGTYGDGPPDDYIADRLESFVNDHDPVRVRLRNNGIVIEIRSAHMPDGGIVTTYTDVTEQVLAEEALERANETLEKRVIERTEQLTRLNGELERAKGEAEEANQSKTRFLAAASHDILQPLNAARLYATTLLETEQSRDDPALAENINASLEAVEDILTALLDISRLDAGAMQVEIGVFRIDDILAQLKREFDPIAKEKGLNLIFVKTSLAVRSDRRLLRRLLQNLISNAIKYTPRGRVIVGVRRARGRAIIQVWDTGIGIPEHKRREVFQEFQRLEQGARVARGLGLGLSIVERIARVLDHEVELHSDPGQGSCFSVNLPVTQALPKVDQEAVSVPTIGVPLAGTLVLAIDNEPAILDGMKRLLTGWGCVAVTAPNLKDAMTEIRPYKLGPDAIVADYHLDDGDGIEAIVALRWKLGMDIPAILVTADRSPEVRDAAAEKSIHVLHKPLRPAALRSLLAQARALRTAAE
jgi:Na+/proline symporter/signal transduction histidine kinase